MASPHKTPTKIKKLRGTDRADRRPKNEIEPALLTDLPVPPDTLDEVGAELWYRVCGQLIALDMLSVVGIPQIEDYCINYQFYIKAVNSLNKGRLVMKSGNISRVNPAYKIMQDCRMAMIRYEDRWGMSPSSQAKIEWKKTEEEGDEFEI